MNKRSKAVFIALVLLMIAGASFFLLRYNQESFTGSRVKNPDAYLLDIQRMNGTDLHTLELREGDVLQIQFETEKGSLYMEIKAPDGTSLYRGNGKETTDFTVNIRESGVYTIVVEARHAKGTIHVQLAGRNTIPSNWERAMEDELWKVTLAEDLLQKYGVLPKYYEDLGDGIYQVYVEVGGEIVPFVTVNSATGDYHG